MKLLKNIKTVYSLDAAIKKGGRNLLEQDLSPKQNISILLNDNKIIWFGTSEKIPKEFIDYETIDCANYIALPHFVDSHTHLVFAGDRSLEYSQRLNGEDYQKIARSGGGILHTVDKTKAASKEELFKLACERIERIASKGVRVIEVKSGYGLDHDTEIKISMVIDQLKSDFKNCITIKNTFMAAHAVPKEFSSSHDYIVQVVIPLMEELHDKKIIDAVDIFHEDGYFSKEDVDLLFAKAKEIGLDRKIHADEFNDNDGANIATQYNCLSADHLLCVSDTGIKALANSSTVATLLPGTGFFLGKKQANARALLDAGAKVAIASDFNPGSCHFSDLFKIACMIAPTYKMNIAELLSAITINPLSALSEKINPYLEVESAFRLNLIKSSSLEHLIYNWDEKLCILNI